MTRTTTVGTSPPAGHELDPDLPPSVRPRRIVVVSDSPGKACRPAGAVEAYGTYPGVACRTWQYSTGLQSGAAVPKGSILVACQADLGIANPIFTARQTNTWWVWGADSDDHWDYFPETAIAEGAPDHPINGIALCEAAP